MTTITEVQLQILNKVADNPSAFSESMIALFQTTFNAQLKTSDEASAFMAAPVEEKITSIENDDMIAEKDKRIAELEEELGVKNKEIIEKDKEIKRWETSCKYYEEKKDELQDYIRELDQKCRDIRFHYNEIKEELSQSSGDKGELISKLYDEIERKEDEIKDLNKEIKSLKGQILLKNVELKELKSGDKTAEEVVSKEVFEKVRDEAVKEMANLKNQCDEFQKTIKEKDKEIAELKKQPADNNEELISNLYDEIEEKDKEIKRLEEEITSLENKEDETSDDEVKALYNEIEEKDKEIEDLKKEIESMTKEKEKQLKERLKEKSELISDQVKELNEATDKIEKLEKELKAKDKEIEDLKAGSNADAELLEMLEAREKEIAEKDKEIEDLKKARKTSKKGSDNDMLIKEYEETINKLQGQVAALQLANKKIENPEDSAESVEEEITKNIEEKKESKDEKEEGEGVLNSLLRLIETDLNGRGIEHEPAEVQAVWPDLYMYDSSTYEFPILTVEEYVKRVKDLIYSEDKKHHEHSLRAVIKIFEDSDKLQEMYAEYREQINKLPSDRVTDLWKGCRDVYLMTPAYLKRWDNFIEYLETEYKGKVMPLDHWRELSLPDSGPQTGGEEDLWYNIQEVVIKFKNFLRSLASGSLLKGTIREVNNILDAIAEENNA